MLRTALPAATIKPCKGIFVEYLFDIRIDGKKRSYRIEASDEEEAIERLKLRLPPSQRDAVVIDEMRIDMATVSTDDPYGSFGGE
jgi:hypothetical protein